VITLARVSSLNMHSAYSVGLNFMLRGKKEVRQKLTLRNKLERRRLSILETADSGIISASNPASSIASIISST